MPALAVTYLAAYISGTLATLSTFAITMAFLTDVMMVVSYATYASHKGDMPLYDSGYLVNTSSSEEPVPVLYGRHRIGGNIVYISTSGSDNEYLHIIMTLSEGPIEGIESIYLDDKLITDPDYEGLHYYEFFNGSGSQGICTTLQVSVSEWADAMRWTSYLYLRLKFDSEVFSGIPDITVVAKGRQIYDPRTGNTAYSTNPALVWYDFMNNKRYGLGVDSAYIDAASVMSAANWCETQATPYTFNGLIVDRKAFIDNIKEVMNNFRADVIWSSEEGEYKLLIRQYSTPAMVLKEEEIVADSFTFSLPGLSDTPNRVKFSYPDEEDNWVAKDQITEDTEAVLQYDNEERDMEIALIGTTNATQANLLAIYHLERARNNKVFSFTAHPKAFILEPGDIIKAYHTLPGWQDPSSWAPSVTRSLYDKVTPTTTNGYYYKCTTAGTSGASEPTWPTTPDQTVNDGTVVWTCYPNNIGVVRVMEVNFSQDGLAALTVQEEDPLLYDDTLNLSPHTHFSTSLPDPLAVVAGATNVTFTEEEYFNKNVSYTRLKVTFTAPTSPFWDYSEAWVNAGGAGYTHYTDARGSFTVEPVKEGAQYSIKLLSVSIQGVRASISTATEWSYTVIGKNTPPDDVTNFQAIPQSDTIILTWDAVSNLDLWGYELRKGTSWNSGIYLSFTSACAFQINGVPPGTHSFMIKSVDTRGAYSENYGMASCTVYGPASYTEKMSEYNDYSDPSAWAATTAKALGDKVIPVGAGNGFYYKCTTAGTTASTAPTWPTTNGATVTDGTVVWTAYQTHSFSSMERYTDPAYGVVLRAVHGSDEFKHTEQNLMSGGDGVKSCGWYMLNSANADAVNINTSNTGKLTIDCNAVSTAANNVTFNAPFVYKNLSGDFEVETYVSSSTHNEATEYAFMAVRDLTASAGEDNVWMGIGHNTADFSLYTRNTVNGSSSGNANTGVQDPYLKITRSGSVFTFYSKATEGGAWTQRAQYTRADFGSSIQVGLGAFTNNTTNTLVAQFDYFRVLSGGLTGTYTSPVYDRGSSTTRRSWVQYDWLFVGTGAAWWDQFTNIDLWTDRVGVNDTWLSLFGSFSAGTVEMKFLYSTDGVNWSTIEDFEVYVCETQAKYAKYQMTIADVDGDGYMCIKPNYYKEAYFL